MGIPPDFKNQFYNLQGIHINERKKNFNKLLLSASPHTTEDQIDIQPRNYQENIFYVDVLIHFRKVEKLIEILKEGTGVLTSRILKQQWFFQEAFRNMSEEDIVNNFLPSLSYSLRMKVLKKLSLALSEDRMDKIFDIVLERYGLFIATQFLFSCSKDKIVNVLRNNELTLLSEQLKRLLQKDVDLIRIYFEEYEKNMRTKFDDYDFLRYLAWKRPNMYFELELNSKGHIKLGRNTTRSVVRSNNDDVLKNIKNSEQLNSAALIREIKEFDKEYFYLFFPEDKEALKGYTYRSTLHSLICKYPIKKRWEVLSRGFKLAYDTEIVEHLDLFDHDLANHFPEKLQEKWAEIKFLDSDNLEYIKYYDTKKAFKLLKDKINVTSDIIQRGRLLYSLISACYNKKDYSTYEAVLKYICTRHRNDDQNVRANMIYHINNNINYNCLTEVHWKYINELIDIQRVRNEVLSFDIITEYLLFVYQKQLPLDGPVIQFAKDCIKNHWTFRLWYQLKEPEVQQIILKHIVKILSTIEQEDPKRNTYEIMSNIVDFNKDIKEDKILNKEFTKYWIDLNDCPLIMELINQVCTKQAPYDDYDCDVVKNLIRYNCLYSETPLEVVDEQSLLSIVETMTHDDDKRLMVGNYISDIITKPKRNTFENSLLRMFFNIPNDEYAHSLKQTAINYFLIHEPEVIAEYFNVILPIKSNCDVLDFHIIKRYSHLGLDEKVIAHFKDSVSVNSKCETKVKLLSALSRVMHTKDFLNLVQEYTPKSTKLDLHNEDQREMYQIQCELAKVFRNLDDISKVAPVVMNFCQGDYLQSSLPSLYKVLYRVNEQKVLYYINILSERAMSTKKHAVFLGFQLLPLKDATNLYSVISHKETNISAKKYLFDAILKYFLKNSLESILDIVFLNMGFIDKNDNEMIEKLVESVNNVSSKYKPLFFEKVWNFMVTLEHQDVNVTIHRKNLLNNINGCGASFILRLNKTFCDDLINTYFLSNDDRYKKMSDIVDYFVLNYLLTYLDESHFEFVFNIIKSYKDNHWESHDKDIIAVMFYFFSKAYEYFYKNDVKFLDLFSSFWKGLFSHHESFSEYTMLRLMDVYNKNADVQTFSREVDKYFQELTNKYGLCIGELLISSLKEFYSNIPAERDSDFNAENFAFHLLQSSTSDFNCLTAFTIIRNFDKTDKKKTYAKVVDALKVISSSTASIYYNVLVGKN